MNPFRKSQIVDKEFLSQSFTILFIEPDKYLVRFKMSAALAKENCFKMNVTLHF